MDINVRAVQGITVVELAGELTWKSAPEAQVSILEQAQPGGKQAQGCDAACRGADDDEVAYRRVHAGAGVEVLWDIARFPWDAAIGAPACAAVARKQRRMSP